jgi:hypothetical protein
LKIRGNRNGGPDGDDNAILQRVVGVRYHAVIIHLFGPFVDDCSGEDGRHVGTVDGGDVPECSRFDGIAAVFAEKDGDGIARELRHSLCVSRSLEGVVAALSYVNPNLMVTDGGCLPTRKCLR